MVVCKFGGSSVSDAKQIRKVAAIAAQEPRRRFIVVSAPGKRYKGDEKITDLLYQCHREAAEGLSISDTFGKIKSRFLQIAEQLQAGAAVAPMLEEIEEQIAAGASADYAASRGEFLSAVMIAEYLGAEFLEASEAVRLTEDGRVDERSYGLLAERIGSEATYVMPGFYGAGPDGQLKTFSRGGSDISGAIAARAAEAEVYENWTDVSGILMADPRAVDNPPPVANLTYREVREMASVGAAVFHEEAIAPVRDVGIPINIRNTNDPDARGTYIINERDDREQVPVVGVSGKEPYRAVRAEKFMLSRYAELPERLRQALGALDAAPEFELRGFDTITFYVPEGRQFDEGTVCAALRDAGADGCTAGESTAMLGLVGEGIGDRDDLLAELFRVLLESGVHVRGINLGGSPVTLLLAIDREAYTDALNAVVQMLKLLD
jgi:aspartate kinase